MGLLLTENILPFSPETYENAYTSNIKILFGSVPRGPQPVGRKPPPDYDSTATIEHLYTRTHRVLSPPRRT